MSLASWDPLPWFLEPDTYHPRLFEWCPGWPNGFWWQLPTGLTRENVEDESWWWWVLVESRLACQEFDRFARSVSSLTWSQGTYGGLGGRSLAKDSLPTNRPQLWTEWQLLPFEGRLLKYSRGYMPSLMMSVEEKEEVFFFFFVFFWEDRSAVNVGKRMS